MIIKWYFVASRLNAAILVRCLVSVEKRVNGTRINRYISLWLLTSLMIFSLFLSLFLSSLCLPLCVLLQF